MDTGVGGCGARQSIDVAFCLGDRVVKLYDIDITTDSVLRQH